MPPPGALPRVGGIEVDLAPDSAEGGRRIARWMVERAAAVRGRPAVLGLATGRSTLPIYPALVERIRSGALDATALETFNLDEYLGLPAGHAASFERFMEHALFEPARLDRARCHFPASHGADAAAAAERYERDLREAGGIDVQLLGIGVNGHIGFNEPGSARDSRTRRVELSERTREQNADAFGGDPARVPGHAITMGIATILEARAIVLAAWGESKAEAVERALTGPVGPDVPASFLRTHPGPVRFVVDPPAATRIRAALAAGEGA